MSYWMATIPYQGIATIAIETKDDKQPSMSDFRRHLQMQEVDLGSPIFKTQNPDIEEIDKEHYNKKRKIMFRKSSIDKIANEILKSASSLTGVQEEAVTQFLESDPQMSFQEIAKFLSSKIKANESIIYSFLMTCDSLTRNNDYLKKV